jgi:tetratricopeptide (TPR) repeat protein
VRALVESGALRGARGRYRLERAPDNLQLPATTQAILAARIDRLASEDKRLLQAAAMVGKDVPWVLLEAIADLSGDELRASLGRLQASEFLYEIRLFPDPEYTFKHALTHEVAYGSLLRDRRRQLHAAIVAAIESLYADRLGEQVPRLAHHAERGEVWDKAVGYLRRAGDVAMHSANPQAVDYFTRAVAAADRLPSSQASAEVSIDLLMKLRFALFVAGRIQRTLEIGVEAKARAEAIGDRRRAGRACSIVSNSCFMLGEHTRAIDLAEQALVTAADIDDPILRAMIELPLGEAHYCLGAYDRAIDVLTRNIEFLDTELRRTRPGVSHLHHVLSGGFLGMALAERGEFAEAMRVAEQAMAHAADLGTSFAGSMAHWTIGMVRARQGFLASAVVALETACRGAQSHEIHSLSPWVEADLGYAYALSRRTREAVPLLERALERGAAEVKAGQSLRMTYLGTTHLIDDRPSAAADCAGHALARAQSERGWEAYAHVLAAQAAAHPSTLDAESAARHYGDALSLAERLGMRPLLARAHQGLGRLYRETGKPVEARDHLVAAAAMYEDLGIPPATDGRHAPAREP